MKRSVFIFAAVLLVWAVSAQSNNMTYYLDDYDVRGKRVTVIPGTVQPCVGNPANCDQIVFSTSAHAIAKPQEFMLIRTDFYGNFSQASLHAHEMELHHIITTADNGILVAGIPNRINADALAMLAVIKLDASLNVQWSRQIPLRYRNILLGRENIGIEAVYYPDLDEEHYFIACNEGSPIASVSEDGVISVVRIDQNGNLIWHKTYENQSRPLDLPGPPYYGVVLYQKDGVNDLTTYMDEDQGKLLLCITGTRYSYLHFWGSQQIDNQLFFMSIDEDGDIVYDYQIYHTNHYAFAPDMVWDGTHLVTIYEQQHTFPSPPAPPTYITGIVRLNPDLTIVDQYYYEPFYPRLLSYRGQSITLGLNGEYVVGCWKTGDPAGRTAGFFLIDPVTMTTSPLRLHNQLRDQVYYDQKHFTDAAGFHYMIPTVNKAYSSALHDRPRLLKADPTLMETCGGYDESVLITPGYGSMLYYSRQEVPGYEIYDYYFGIEEMDFQQDRCIDDPDPTTYRPATGSGSATEPAVSPTLLSGIAEPVNVRYHSDTEGFMDIAVYNTLGQLIDEQRTAAHKGDNSFTVNARFAPGINLVTLSCNGVTTTRKIIVGQ